MEEYRRKTKKKVTIWTVLVLLGIAAVVTAGFISSRLAEAPEAERLYSFMLGFPVGMMTGLLVVAAVVVGRYWYALRSDDALRKLKISEEDERSRMIRDKIGGVGFPFAMGIIGVGGAVFSFFNSVVSLALFAALLVMALIMLVLKAYYYSKY